MVVICLFVYLLFVYLLFVYLLFVICLFVICLFVYLLFVYLFICNILSNEKQRRPHCRNNSKIKYQNSRKRQNRYL
jgi:hypothetical protein